MAKKNPHLVCCIQTCRLNLLSDHGEVSLEDVYFYTFPTDPFLRRVWSEKCSASPSNETKICSLHFTDNDYETVHSEFLNFAPKRILKKNAVPSQNLPTSILCGTSVKMDQHLHSSSTVSVLSHSDWSPTKSSAQDISLKLDVHSDLISSIKCSQVWELCRMCAGSSESMIPIFNEDGSDRDNTAFKLKHFFSLKVTSSDALPIRLCGQCFIDLNFCQQLAQKCAQADTALHSLLEVESTTNDNQDLEAEWHLQDVQQEISEPPKVIWESGTTSNEVWNHGERDTVILDADVSLNCQKEVHLKEEPTKQTEADDESPIEAQESIEKQERRTSTRLKKVESPNIKNPVSLEENLENIPLRDRLRNKTRRNEAVFLCKECGKNFDKRIDLKQHLQNSHDKYECKVCAELFDSQEEAIDHESIPHNIPCLECKEVFPTLSSMQTHNEMEHVNKKPFVCSECGNHFISKVTLRVHMRTHSGKRTTICDTCGKAFRTSDALRQHKFVHMTDDEKKSMGFPCTMCDKKFSRRTKLEYHMRRHTGERHFTCTICNKSFHDSVRLKAHVERHSTDKKFKCDECGSGFVCKRYLTNHKSRYHRRKEVIRCTVCAKVLPSIEEAIVHHRLHSAEEIAKSGASDPYLHSFDHHCRQCADYFPSKEMLDAHKAKAHIRGRSAKATTQLDISELMKQVDCTVCGKKLWGMGSLKRHMSTHAGSRPERIFQCEFCAKMFAQKAQLVVHIRTHTGERPHRCSFCGKGFITGQSLIKHERIHTGETPFHCTQCPKAFRSKENLILHQKTHLGLKPFECHYCHKGFGRQIHLQLHLRTHTGERPYVCDICGRAFAQGGDMRRHKLTHTGERAYKCSVCCFSSNKRKTLRDHEAAAHGKSEGQMITEIAVAPRPMQATVSVPPSHNLIAASHQFTATIIQDPRTVMFLTPAEVHKNWEGN